MSVDFSKLSANEIVGGDDCEEYEDDYLFAQSQHLIVDTEKLYVSMMLNRNFRIVNKSDKGVTDAPIGDDVKLAAGMCFRGDDEILVVDCNDNKVVVCNRNDGSFKTVFATGFDHPNSVACDSNGNILVGSVGDGFKGVKIFDSNGKETQAISTSSGANYVTYDHVSNRILVTDTDACHVEVYSADGKDKVFTIEGLGGAPELSNPSGTAVDQHGNIFVCDTGNSHVHVYDKDGKFQAFLADDEDNFNCPMDVFVTSDNEVVVLDGSPMSGWSRIQKYQC